MKLPNNHKIQAPGRPCIGPVQTQAAVATSRDSHPNTASRHSHPIHNLLSKRKSLKSNSHVRALQVLGACRYETSPLHDSWTCLNKIHTLASLAHFPPLYWGRQIRMCQQPTSVRPACPDSADPCNMGFRVFVSSFRYELDTSCMNTCRKTTPS